MRALVVYCHPSEASYTAAVRDVVLDKLAEAGADVTCLDLYAEGFEPVLAREEWDLYLKGPQPGSPLASHIAAIRSADTLIFVYPTWWYGLPAILKGWLDRVLLPDVAFSLPECGGIIPTMTHIRRIGVFTTCGASRWLTFLVGAPGRKTLLRGVRFLCARNARTYFAAHYDMDCSTDATRAKHLTRVAARMDKLIGRAGMEPRGVKGAA